MIFVTRFYDYLVDDIHEKHQNENFKAAHTHLHTRCEHMLHFASRYPFKKNYAVKLVLCFDLLLQL